MSKALQPELIEFFNQFSEKKDLKAELALRFNDFIAEPAKYGANAEQVKKISEASEGDKESMKKAFVKALVKQFKAMNTEQEAQAIIEDLQDGYDKDLSKAVFKEMLNNPGDPKYKLELETIQSISGMDKVQKESILKALYKEKGIKPDVLEEFGEKFKDFFVTILEKFSPIFMIFTKALIGIGTKKLVKVIDKDVTDDELSEVLQETVKETGSAIKEAMDETALASKKMEGLKIAHHESSAPHEDVEINISGALNASIVPDHS